MNEPLEMLLLRVEAGNATPEDLAELERVMQTPEGRKLVVDSLMLNAVLSETLATGDAKTSSSARREVVQFHDERTERSERTERPASRMTGRRTATRRARANPFSAAMAIAALLAVIVGAVVLFQKLGTPAAEPEAKFAIVEQFFGDVAEVSSAKRPISVGTELLEGEALETGINSYATLVFADSTTLRLSPNTRISNVSLKTGKHARLERGRIDAEVAPQPQNSPMVFQTPQAAVTVVGTEFSLDVGTAATRLDVETGTVRMARSTDGAAVEVASRQFAVASPEVALVAKPKDPPATEKRTIALVATADTYVRAGKEAANNFGSEPLIGVKHDDGRHERESLIRFDLSGVKGRIVEARLRLHVFSMDENSRYTHSITFLTNAAWQENTVTWKTRPTGGATLATWTPQPKGFVNIDLTPSLQPSFLKLQNWDFRIFAPNIENERSWCFYSARETKNPPTLTLTVVSDTSPPTP